MRYRIIEPGRAYVTNNLLLPKEEINIRAVKNALEFIMGEEVDIDPLTGEFLGMKNRILKLWDENDTHMVVPRNFIGRRDYCKFNFEFSTEGVSFDTVPFVCLANPRNEIQEKALEAIVCSNRDGILNLACGIGKTVISLMVIAELRTPTLIVVNSKNLIAQWSEEIREHLRVDDGRWLAVPEIGIIGGGKVEIDAPVVLATIQSLSAKRDSLYQAIRERFGLVIYDEAHHMSAPVFVQGADVGHGRRLALTATASRTDGLESIYQYHLGPVLYRYLEQELIPHTYFYRLVWDMPPGDIPQILDKNGEIHTSKIKTYLGAAEWRNDLIAAQIRRDLEEGREILVLSHSKEGVKNLARRFGENNYIIGDIRDENERHRILRESNPAFGVFHLAREALNKPTMDTLYITTVFGNSNDLQQSWGRIQRVKAGKQDTVVRVYEDDARALKLAPTDKRAKKPLKSCVRSCGSLRRFLKALRYPFDRITVIVEDEDGRSS